MIWVWDLELTWIDQDRPGSTGRYWYVSICMAGGFTKHFLKTKYVIWYTVWHILKKVKHGETVTSGISQSENSIHLRKILKNISHAMSKLKSNLCLHTIQSHWTKWTLFFKIRQFDKNSTIRQKFDKIRQFDNSTKFDKIRQKFDKIRQNSTKIRRNST